MSRIGKKPIEIPSGVEVKILGRTVTVKGPKGTLSKSFDSALDIIQHGKSVVVQCKIPDEKKYRAMWGLARAIIANMLAGVTKGFEKKLEISGVGYRASVSGKKLMLALGFSHPVEYEFPEGIMVTVDKNIITVSGVDKQLVGEAAAQIRSLRAPEPYKGKGIRYVDEVVRRKAGKAVKAAGAAGGAAA